MNETVIFYFTGTGNSLAIANELASQLGNTAVKSIPQVLKQGNFDLPYQRIGFVFPVYYSFAPQIVKRFVEKLSFSADQYIFSIISCGSMAGSSMLELGNIISAQNGKLNAGFKIMMPGNYIASYSAFPKFVQRLEQKRMNKKVTKISNIVREKRTTKIPVFGFPKSMQVQCRNIISTFGEDAKNFNVNSNCNQCGLCVKICPIQNISMKSSFPVWGGQCEKCMACIQWCPKQAINYGDKTMKRTRYHNPNVKVSDLAIF